MTSLSKRSRPPFGARVVLFVAAAGLLGCAGSGASPPPRPVTLSLPSPGPAEGALADEPAEDAAVAVDQLRLLLVRAGRLLAVDPKGQGEAEPALDELAGRVRSARSIEGGRAVLVIAELDDASAGDGLWSAEAGVPLRLGPQRVRGPLGHFGAVDPAGRTMVLEDSGQGTAATLRLLRRQDGAEPTLETLWEVRYHSGSDVSDDGTHVLVSGVDTSCTSDSLSACPIHVSGMDLGAREPELVRLSDPRVRVAYHPHFEPTMAASYAFTYQTTAHDPSRECHENLNACRHDVVLRPWGAAQRTTVLEEALGPYVAPGDDARAYLTYERCGALPCDELTLHLRHRGEDHAVAHDVVSVAEHMWSPNGRWLAYVAKGEDDTRPVRVVSVADGSVYTVGSGAPHAWIRLD